MQIRIGFECFNNLATMHKTMVAFIFVDLTARLIQLCTIHLPTGDRAGTYKDNLNRFMTGRERSIVAHSTLQRFNGLKLNFFDLFTLYDSIYTMHPHLTIPLQLLSIQEH
jgi:hypothetical protein